MDGFRRWLGLKCQEIGHSQGEARPPLYETGTSQVIAMY